MAEAKLDVGKWQAARRQWQYTPVLWFYFRMVEVAYLDARSKCSGQPSNEALLARDWIARSETANREFISFPHCCSILGLNVEIERIALLELIDRATDSDNDESWSRLEELNAADLKDDAEPLFDALRIVPALDQMELLLN